MDLVFANCFAFNQAGQDAYEMGKTVEAHFRRKWADKKPLADLAFNQLVDVHQYRSIANLFEAYKFRPPTYDVPTNRLLPAHRPAGKIPPLFTFGDHSIVPPPAALPVVPAAVAMSVPAVSAVSAGSVGSGGGPATAVLAGSNTIRISGAMRISLAPKREAPAPTAMTTAVTPAATKTESPPSTSMASLWNRTKTELAGVASRKRKLGVEAVESGQDQPDEAAKERAERRAVGLHWTSRSERYLRRKYLNERTNESDERKIRKLVVGAATTLYQCPDFFFP